MAEQGKGSKQRGKRSGRAKAGEPAACDAAAAPVRRRKKNPEGSARPETGGHHPAGEAPGDTPGKPVAADAARPRRAAVWDGPRTYATVPLSNLVPAVTRPAYRKRSPAGAILLTDWERVVGPRLAAQTMPNRLSRGILTIACVGPVAMELQHLSATLIDRINTHAGEALVTQLRFQQSTVAAPPPPSAARRQKAAPMPLPDLPEGELNDALARLLAAIRSDSKV